MIYSDRIVSVCVIMLSIIGDLCDLYTYIIRDSFDVGKRQSVHRFNVTPLCVMSSDSEYLSV